jgi:hypothetical protein
MKMGIIVRDSSGRVEQVSSDLKGKVKIGSTLSGAEARRLTSPSNRSSIRNSSSSSNNNNSSNPSSSNNSQSSNNIPQDQLYVTRTGGTFNPKTGKLTSSDGRTVSVTSDKHAQEIIKQSNPYVNTIINSPTKQEDTSNRAVKKDTSANNPFAKIYDETRRTPQQKPSNFVKDRTVTQVLHKTQELQKERERIESDRKMSSFLAQSHQQREQQLQFESTLLTTRESNLQKSRKYLNSQETREQYKQKVSDLNEDMGKFVNKSQKHSEKVKQGTIEAKETPSILSSEYWDLKGSELESKREQSRIKQSRTGSVYNTLKYAGLSMGAGAVSGVVGIGELFIPYDFNEKKVKAPDLAVMGYKIVTASPKEVGNFVVAMPSMLKSFGEDIIDRPAYNLGKFLAIKYAPKVVSGTANKVRDLYVKTGSKYYPKESVFSSQVLSGKNKFPMVKSTKETKKLVEATKTQLQIKKIAPGVKIKPASHYKVVTSSPTKISSNTVGMGGKRSQLGKQDPGIYSTAFGEGSPHFLGVSDDVQYGFSLNPFKNTMSKPTVTAFKVKNIKTYPKKILKTSDFKAVGSFQKTNVGKGNVYITKRSMIGQGELPNKNYYDFSRKIIRNPGTGEHELVVGVGEKFKYTPKTTLGKFKGFDAYTTFNGRAVALREAELLTTKATSLNKLSSSNILKGSKIILGKKILDESRALNLKYITPSTIARYSTLLPKTSLVPSSLSTSSRIKSLNLAPSSKLTSIHNPKSKIPSFSEKYLRSYLGKSSFLKLSSSGSSSKSSSSKYFLDDYSGSSKSSSSEPYSSSFPSSSSGSSGGSSGSSSGGGSSSGSSYYPPNYSSSSSSSKSSLLSSSTSKKEKDKTSLWSLKLPAKNKKRKSSQSYKKWLKTNPWANVSNILKTNKKNKRFKL